MRGETLTAQEGYVYTDGIYFGKIVCLRRGDDGSAWRQVPEEEMTAATEEDYRQALERFGVAV